MDRSLRQLQMKILFDKSMASLYDAWGETRQGRGIYELEAELLTRFGGLAFGEEILEVGCGTGAHLEIFRKQGLHVFGVDVSPHMLGMAHRRLGKGAPLCLGEAENLPFRDTSLDSVALITTLEFIANPRRALEEALRVSRGSVLLGVLNRFSLLALIRRVKGTFRSTIYEQARFYTIWQLRRLIAQVAPKATVDWGSVLILPLSWQSHFPELERRLSFRRNPCGAFLGVKVSNTEV